MTRSIYIVGNWKMHMAAGETRAFVESLVPQVSEAKVHVWIAPPFTSIEAGAAAAKGSAVRIGAQNMSEYPKGAYTGEISSEMLKEAGADFVILGHSERRSHFHEDDQMIHRKLKWALKEQLKPILCVGETQEERDREMTRKVLERQLGEGLKDFTPDEVKQVLIAYEPVWAIGTGKTATPEIAEETHHLCRAFLEKNWGKETAEQIAILYGGSVKPGNIRDLITQPNIDGALIGGASLEVDSLRDIIKFTEEVIK